MRRQPHRYASRRVSGRGAAWQIGGALSIAIASCSFASTRVSAADACPDSSQDIVTDRPSVTNSSLVVPMGSLQAENGVNWTTRAGQGALDGPNTRLRLGVAHCSEFLVDLPDYSRGIYGAAPDGFSDIAPAIKHQFEACPRVRLPRQLSASDCQPGRSVSRGLAISDRSYFLPTRTRAREKPANPPVLRGWRFR